MVFRGGNGYHRELELLQMIVARENVQDSSIAGDM